LLLLHDPARYTFHLLHSLFLVNHSYLSTCYYVKYQKTYFYDFLWPKSAVVCLMLKLHICNTLLGPKFTSKCITHFEVGPQSMLDPKVQCYNAMYVSLALKWPAFVHFWIICESAKPVYPCSPTRRFSVGWLKKKCFHIYNTFFFVIFPKSYLYN
jgi:hypothetical protein